MSDTTQGAVQPAANGSATDANRAPRGLNVQKTLALMIVGTLLVVIVAGVVFAFFTGKVPDLPDVWKTLIGTLITLSGVIVHFNFGDKADKPPPAPPAA